MVDRLANGRSHITQLAIEWDCLLENIVFTYTVTTLLGTESTYPWSAEPYEITSDPFIVEPAELSVSINDTNDGLYEPQFRVPNGDTD